MLGDPRICDVNVCLLAWSHWCLSIYASSRRTRSDADMSLINDTAVAH